MGVVLKGNTMVDLNIANFITIGLISVASYAALIWAFQMLGIDTKYLGM
jgi:hypothetical protein